MEGERITDQDRFERDEKGKLRGEKKKERSQDSSSFRGKGYRGEGNNGNNKKIFLILLLITLIGLLGISKGWNFKGIDEIKKYWGSAPGQHLNNMFNSMEEASYENRQRSDFSDGEFYDNNRLYSDRGLDEMVERYYIVYMYTGDKDKDKVFNKWVNKFEQEIQIYKLNVKDVEMKGLEEKNPRFILYIEKNDVKREVDMEVSNEKDFEGLVDRVQEIKAERENIDY